MCLLFCGQDRSGEAVELLPHWHPFYLDLEVRCSSQPQAFQNRVLFSDPPVLLIQIAFPRAVSVVLNLLLGCSACQRFLCTWEAPLLIGLAWPGMLGHLFSCGTGTAARQAIVEDCPHLVRLCPLLGAKKKAVLCCHKSWRAGRRGGDETHGAELS